MVHLLFALLAGLSWAIWFVLQWSIAIPIATTAALGALSLGVWLFQRIRARRRASALEKAIGAQADQQAANARPDKREEITALKKQMRDGITALKDSNVGGKRRGETAMYALPWYAIIGPPGVGKTTALRHSGLTFPHTDGGVRGVGGTRNCDWWFTNEAVLLDTAGRYATEAEDQQEWLEFLDMLREHRVNKPLNGLILAVALPDIVNASEQELEAMSKKLRSRVDEVMTRLRMTLPVYFLLTKCDLVAGFVELFGDLRKSERAQPWGATIPLKADKTQPGEIFAREFDLMVQGVHGRAVKRLASERDRRARESIYQFPIELGSVKRQVGDLVAQIFAPNSFQATPLFRGFYFTSGTQVGLPLSRALEKMSHAMGIHHAATEDRPRLEPKSYFLHDVFTKVVFPDADVAARSRSEVRRQRFVRLSIAATAMALAVTIAGPSVNSYRNNRELIASSNDIAAQAAEIDWDDSSAVEGKLAKLTPLLEQVKKLEVYADNRPLNHRFLMYAGEEVRGPLLANYVAHMQAGFLRTVRHQLEGELLALDGKHYYRDRERLKTYLMLSETEHLDVAWATGKLTRVWVEAVAHTAKTSKDALTASMLPHVSFYLELLESKRAKARPADAEVVDKARTRLAEVPVIARYESLFITSVEEAVYNPAEGKTRQNLQFPGITLADVFYAEPEILAVIRSKQHQRTQRYYEVPGPYTDKGHFGVLANFKEAPTILKSEAWVVPLDDAEKRKMATHLDAVAVTYEKRYTDHWRAFAADITLAPVSSLKDAAARLDALRGHGESPLLRLLRTLEDHTQWTKSVDDLMANQAAVNVINRRINTAFTRRVRGLRLGADIRNMRGRLSTVPGEFSDAVAFGVPPKGGNINDTRLGEYVDELGSMRALILQKITVNPKASPNVVARDMNTRVERTDALLKPRDIRTKQLLRELLVAPFSLEESTAP